MISIIVAADENNVIGKDNQLIWHLPDDLRFFKKKTTGHCVIMGRKTYESMGRPLPKRTNVVITRDENYRASGCTVVHSIEEALKACQHDENPYIIGGEQIYRLGMPFAERIFLSRIHHTFDGDRHFPELTAEWERTDYEFHPKDERHDHDFTFETYLKSRN